MLDNKLTEQKLHFRVSEPFEFGYEDNPDPILLEIIGSVFSEGKPRLVVRGLIKDRGKVYSVGVAGARYRGDSLVDILGAGRRCTVNSEFFPSAALEHERNTFDDGALAELFRVPRESRLMLIGDLSFV